MFFAAQAGHVEVLRVLLRHGGRPDTPTTVCQTGMSYPWDRQTAGRLGGWISYPWDIRETHVRDPGNCAKEGRTWTGELKWV